MPNQTTAQQLESVNATLQQISKTLSYILRELQKGNSGKSSNWDTTDSFRAGKEERKLGIKPAAEALGLTPQDLGRQVRLLAQLSRGPT